MHEVWKLNEDMLKQKYRMHNLYVKVSFLKFFEEDFQETIKGSCRSWGDLSSIWLVNVPQLRQLSLRQEYRKSGS